MSSDPDPQQRRQNVLTLFLALIGAGFFGVVLVLLTGGLFLYVFFVAGFLVALGFLNYLLWGKVMSDMTAGEREEELRRERAEEEEEWPRRLRR